jgi:hypothetical protein
MRWTSAKQPNQDLFLGRTLPIWNPGLRPKRDRLLASFAIGSTRLLRSPVRCAAADFRSPEIKRFGVPGCWRGADSNPRDPSKFEGEFKPILVHYPARMKASVLERICSP